MDSLREKREWTWTGVRGGVIIADTFRVQVSRWILLEKRESGLGQGKRGGWGGRGRRGDGRAHTQSSLPKPHAPSARRVRSGHVKGGSHLRPPIRRSRRHSRRRHHLPRRRPRRCLRAALAAALVSLLPPLNAPALQRAHPSARARPGAHHAPASPFSSLTVRDPGASGVGQGWGTWVREASGDGHPTAPPTGAEGRGRKNLHAHACAYTSIRVHPRQRLGAARSARHAPQSASPAPSPLPLPSAPSPPAPFAASPRTAHTYTHMRGRPLATTRRSFRFDCFSVWRGAHCCCPEALAARAARSSRARLRAASP